MVLQQTMPASTANKLAESLAHTSLSTPLAPAAAAASASASPAAAADISAQSEPPELSSLLRVFHPDAAAAAANLAVPAPSLSSTASSASTKQAPEHVVVAQLRARALASLAARLSSSSSPSIPSGAAAAAAAAGSSSGTKSTLTSNTSSSEFETELVRAIERLATKQQGEIAQWHTALAALAALTPLSPAIALRCLAAPPPQHDDDDDDDDNEDENDDKAPVRSAMDSLLAPLSKKFSVIPDDDDDDDVDVGDESGERSSKRARFIAAQTQAVSLLCALASTSASSAPAALLLARELGEPFAERLMFQQESASSSGREQDEEEKAASEALRAYASLLATQLALAKDSIATTTTTTTGVPDAVNKTAAAAARSHEALASRLVELASSASVASLTPLLEALAFVSLVSSTSVLESLSASESVRTLARLATASGKQQQQLPPMADYSLACVFANLVTPRASESERDVARLRAYAAAAAHGGRRTSAEELPETREQRTERIRALVKGQPTLVEALVALARARSLATRRLVAQALAALATEKESRGKLLEGGAHAAVLAVLRETPAPLTKADWPAVHALAKLLITANPLTVLGPRPDSPKLVEAATALSLGFVSYSSSSSGVGDSAHPLDSGDGGGDVLFIFEVLLALTNVTSLDPSLAERVAARDAVLQALATSLLTHSNKLVRRAAVELVCNLVGMSERAWRFFAADCKTIIALAGEGNERATRLAALGALASLVAHPAVADILKRSIAMLNKTMETAQRDKDQDMLVRVQAITDEMR